MQQYFVEGIPNGSLYQIKDPNTVKHLFHVMRLQEKEEIVLVFDDQIKRLARLVDKKKALFELVKEINEQREMPNKVTIAIGFPKGDKLEWLTQKSTELGVHEIWAFPSERSVVKWNEQKIQKKLEKCKKIAQGAAEQSKRNQVPSLRFFENKQDFVDEFSRFDTILLAYEALATTTNQPLKESVGQLAQHQTILCIFGAEGGISPQELSLFEKNGAKKVGLGPRILRTETAPLYLLSIISYLTENH